MKADTLNAWFKVYKWTNLFSIIFLLIVSFARLPLLFTNKTQDFKTASPQTTTNLPSASIDQVVQNFETISPSKETDKLLFINSEEHTREVLTTRYNFSSIVNFLSRLQVDLMSGLIGNMLLGLVIIIFIIAFISGFLFYGPIVIKYDFEMIKNNKLDRLRWLYKHNLTGIITLAWAIILGLNTLNKTTTNPALDLWSGDQTTEIASEYQHQPKSQFLFLDNYGEKTFTIIGDIANLITIFVLIYAIYFWFTRKQPRKQQLNRMMAHAKALEK